jgi:hypothetical protein
MNISVTDPSEADLLAAEAWTPPELGQNRPRICQAI